ncbi:uncharacterized protein EV154DRAFT_570992 [Mucor mucedo]|uniref:uncharacterized protein n=1 Tax=Mucor mucedo TaxID=29922 RepID=UPI0022212570|nr:uncharacterized protein EV154DRAFT_570992 [Mucor mucedo]KAI7870078.1 hypothetical protein EV154DRAFT_570992 [Mucor mucedo]
MECLDEAEITLPAKDQSTVLSVEGRPKATPRKIVVLEEASASGSGKKPRKSKKPSKHNKNPFIDDEAGCSEEDDNHRQPNDYTTS